MTISFFIVVTELLSTAICKFFLLSLMLARHPVIIQLLNFSLKQTQAHNQCFPSSQSMFSNFLAHPSKNTLSDLRSLLKIFVWAGHSLKAALSHWCLLSLSLYIWGFYNLLGSIFLELPSTAFKLQSHDSDRKAERELGKADELENSLKGWWKAIIITCTALYSLQKDSTHTISFNLNRKIGSGLNLPIRLKRLRLSLLKHLSWGHTHLYFMVEPRNGKVLQTIQPIQVYPCIVSLGSSILFQTPGMAAFNAT